MMLQQPAHSGPKLHIEIWQQFKHGAKIVEIALKFLNIFLVIHIIHIIYQSKATAHRR